MICRAGFVWESRQHFSRFIEDCGIQCEIVTPHMLAAPFFRGVFSCLIIPTGFANPRYSNLLPALRASAPRITKFIENGGNLLVFGAAIENPSAYDWLPVPLTYSHAYCQRSVTCSQTGIAATLIEDYDSTSIECDGIFPSHDYEIAGTSDGYAVVLEKKIGNGNIVVTSIHEYPSRAFLSRFCRSGTQTLF